MYMATQTYTLGYQLYVSGPTTPTVDTMVARYATDNNWVNGQKYLTMDLGEVTLTMNKVYSGTSNGGRYDSTDGSWYMGYSPLGPDVDRLTIETKDTTKNILSVTFYYTTDTNGQLGYGALGVGNGQKVNINSNTALFYVQAGAGGFGSNVNITQIVIQYESTGPVPPVTEKTAVYDVRSTSSASLIDGEAPSGSTVSYTNSYSNGGSNGRLAAGYYSRLTLSGWTGCKIKSITLYMRSNASAGKASLTVATGGQTLASIADSAFNTPNWYGAWSTTFVDVGPIACTERTIASGSSVTITINCSQNSVYCDHYTITYEPA